MVTLTSQIEAILYLKGKPLSLAEIVQHTGGDRSTVEAALIELMGDYAHRDSALEVVETHRGYALQLRSAFHDLVNSLVPLDMGVGTLRTLATIALRGPLPQVELVNLRGSSAYQHVHELVGLGYVHKQHQKEGRSPRLQVTDKFHQDFQFDQLPLTPELTTQATA